MTSLFYADVLQCSQEGLDWTGSCCGIEWYWRDLSVPWAISPRLSVLIIALIGSVSVSAQASLEGIFLWAFVFVGQFVRGKLTHLVMHFINYQRVSSSYCVSEDLTSPPRIEFAHTPALGTFAAEKDVFFVVKTNNQCAGGGGSSLSPAGSLINRSVLLSSLGFSLLI